MSCSPVQAREMRVGRPWTTVAEASGQLGGGRNCRAATWVGPPLRSPGPWSHTTRPTPSGEVAILGDETLAGASCCGAAGEPSAPITRLRSARGLPDSPWVQSTMPVPSSSTSAVPDELRLRGRREGRRLGDPVGADEAGGDDRALVPGHQRASRGVGRGLREHGRHGAAQEALSRTDRHPGRVNIQRRELVGLRHRRPDDADAPRAAPAEARGRDDARRDRRLDGARGAGGIDRHRLDHRGAGPGHEGQGRFGAMSTPLMPGPSGGCSNVPATLFAPTSRASTRSFTKIRQATTASPSVVTVATGSAALAATPAFAQEDLSAEGAVRLDPPRPQEEGRRPRGALAPHHERPAGGGDHHVPLDREHRAVRDRQHRAERAVRMHPPGEQLGRGPDPLGPDHDHVATASAALVGNVAMSVSPEIRIGWDVKPACAAAGRASRAQARAIRRVSFTARR